MEARLYRHVIFDFDGVICDSLKAAIQEINRLREREFPALPVIKDQQDMCVIYAGSLRTCLDPWLTPSDGKRFFDLHSEAMAKRMDNLNAFPGIGDVLSAFGFAGSSIVTSSYSEGVRSVLRRLPLFDERFIHTIAGREQRQTKTAKIRAILESLSLSEAEAVYVGDLESDIQYCRDVPIDIVAVAYGYHPKSYLISKSPTYLVESVNELRELLCGLCLPKTINSVNQL